MFWFLSVFHKSLSLAIKDWGGGLDALYPGCLGLTSPPWFPFIEATNVGVFLIAPRKIFLGSFLKRQKRTVRTTNCLQLNLLLPLRVLPRIFFTLRTPTWIAVIHPKTCVPLVKAR